MADDAERDAMQTRAETAVVGRKVSGLDGQQWAAHVRGHPGCTLPPGAAMLLVAFFDAWVVTLSAAQSQRCADELHKATREWALVLHRRNVAMGQYEVSFTRAIGTVNTFRHAVGLPMFADERELGA